MTNERDRYLRACALFVEAVRLDEGMRNAFVVAETTGDEALRELVAGMLESDATDAGPDVALVDPELIQSVLDWHDDATDRADPSGDESVTPDSVGKYRILDTLGSGGMGAVYIAEQDSPRRRVALKVIRSGTATSEVVRRFRLEGQVHGMLTHPGIAQIHETGSATLIANGAEAGEVAFIVMELVEGRTLDSWSSGDRDLESRIELVAKVAEAVAYAHENGVIHRDLKPANILVNDRGEPKVIDFGIARAVDPDIETLALRTNVGQIIGTLSYMSPEQVSGIPGDIDARTDVYSLGVVLYELLAGRLPYDVGDISLAEAALVIRQADPIRLSAIDLRLRGDLENIATKALHKEPGRRYQTASALAADLRRFLAKEPVSARPVSTLYLLEKFARRNPAVAAMVVVVLVAACTAAGIFRWKNAALIVERRKLTESVAREQAEKVRVQAEQDRVMRLKDRRVLRELLARSARLFPSHPVNVPKLEQWLLDARELRDRLPLHREALAELEAAAGPYTDEQRAVDHAGTATALAAARARIVAIEAGLDAAGSDAEFARLESELERVEDAVERLEGSMERRTSWGFDSERAWLHELLVDLVREFGVLDDEDHENSAVADVQRRLATAKQVGPRTLEDHAGAWSAACERIGASHGELKMTPQMGLIPLGEDPRSGLEEFLHWESHQVGVPLPSRNQSGDLAMRDGTGIVFVLIPGGSFLMGAELPTSPVDRRPNVDPDAIIHEGPIRTVDLPAFFISKFEMTQGQWLRATGENPSDLRPDTQPWRTRDGVKQITYLHPVEQVSWDDCRGVMDRAGLDLPTEEQWERAARGGRSTIWSCGNDKTVLDQFENLADRFCRDNHGPPGWNYELALDDGWTIHAPVGSYRPNDFGLFDVGGNLREWCKNGYDRDDSGAPVYRGEVDGRMSRGGSYSDAAVDARVAGRVRHAASFSNFNLGCRPVRAVTN